MGLRTSSTRPVMPQPAESRKVTRSATSEASSNRRSATVSVRSARVSSGRIADMSCVAGPGVTALTLTPNWLVRADSAGTNPAIPARTGQWWAGRPCGAAWS
jgi:hypothetical protein